MPWFALDDGFDTHPKVRKAGNAAAGLFCRLGTHCAKHLTEGKVDAAIVRDYGTPATVRKLIAVGMLHPVGHDCPRCEQPVDDGYVIHDYLVYNSSRKQVEAARENGRRRQQRGRDRAKDDRESRDSGANLDAKPGENGAPFGEKSRENEPLFRDSSAGQTGTSRRDTLQGATGVPSPPIPSPPVPPAEVPTSERDSGSAPDGGPRIPRNAQPLVDELTANRIYVGWDLKTEDWFLIEALIKRCTISVLVESALAVAQSGVRIRYGSYFLPAWRALPDVPQEKPGLPAVAAPRTIQLPAAPSPQAARRQASRDVLDQLSEQLRPTGDDQ